MAQASQAAEKLKFFAIPSARTEASRRGEARNLSSIQVQQEERFLGGTRASE